MGTIESYISRREGEYYYVIENDGPRALRHGIDRREYKITMIESTEITQSDGRTYVGWVIFCEGLGGRHSISEEDGQDLRAVFETRKTN